MKKYPWPFLTGNCNEDFGKACITTSLVHLKAKASRGLFSLNFRASSNSNYINGLISTKQVGWEAEIACRSTFFSQIHHPDENGYLSISIPTGNLNGDISMSLRLTVLRELNYTSNEFSKEFEGSSFPLRTGDIIGERNVHWLLDHQFAKAPGLKSIFEISPPRGNEADEHAFITEEKKIRIILPRALFEEFHESHQQSSNSRKLYSHTVIIGALVSVLTRLSSEEPQTKAEQKLAFLLQSKGHYNEHNKKDRIQNPLKAAYDLLGGEQSLVHLLVKHKLS
jgi:hypothetical protein